MLFLVPRVLLFDPDARSGSYRLIAFISAGRRRKQKDFNKAGTEASIAVTMGGAAA
jgi:hypothetical protein